MGRIGQLHVVQDAAHQAGGAVLVLQAQIRKAPWEKRVRLDFTIKDCKGETVHRFVEEYTVIRPNRDKVSKLGDPIAVGIK